jgi:hypothetical protein
LLKAKTIGMPGCSQAVYLIALSWLCLNWFRILKLSFEIKSPSNLLVWQKLRQLFPVTKNGDD